MKWPHLDKKNSLLSYWNCLSVALPVLAKLPQQSINEKSLGRWSFYEIWKFKRKGRKSFQAPLGASNAAGNVRVWEPSCGSRENFGNLPWNNLQKLDAPWNNLRKLNFQPILCVKIERPVITIVLYSKLTAIICISEYSWKANIYLLHLLHHHFVSVLVMFYSTGIIFVARFN